MVQTRITAPQTETLDWRELRHDINNRMSILALATGILAQHDNDDVRHLAHVMKSELRDLEYLLQQLKQRV